MTGALTPGTEIGRFVVERFAASGTMGSVYRALDREAGGPVALKVVLGRSEEDLHRFAREAELLAELHHPGIVRYVAHGTTAWGDPYLALEWIDGESVAERIKGVGFTVAESVELVAAVARALAVAHRAKIVHRDLKPSNLVLSGGRIDAVKILDFGVARARGDTELTRAGALLGTPGYFSPEQARGDRDLDARADVFSLGCVLYKCLTGRAPFPGGDILAVLAKVAADEPPAPSTLREGVSPELDALVRRMIAKSRDERPVDADAVARELASLPATGER